MKVEKVEVLYDGWEKNLLLTVRLERTGKVRTYQVGHHGDSSSVLVYDPARRVAAMVFQHRASQAWRGLSERLMEIPSGLTDGEAPDVAARREVLEEAGIRLTDIEHVGDFWVMPGVSTELASVYLAAYSAADRVAAGGGVAGEDEDIDVREVPLAELAALADSGRPMDLRLYATIQALRLRRPELFR